MVAPFDANAFPVKYLEADYIRMVQGLLPKGVIWGTGEIATADEWTDTPDSDTVLMDTPSATREVFDTVRAGWSGSKIDLLLSCFAAELARIEADAWGVLNQTDPGVAEGDFLTAWESQLGLVSTGTDAERQTAANLKLFAPLQTLTAAHLIQMAADAGFTVTVDDTVYRGRFVCGVAVCGDALCDGGQTGNSTVVVTVTAGTGDYSALQSAVAEITQAHVVVIWIDGRV